MTNPNQAIRMLVVYSIIIPLAVFLGYMLTNPLDYTTIGFIGIIIALVISPVFIKWHYPIMIFGLTLPAQMFFLKGNPPCWQIVVIISLAIAIVERTLNSEKRFLSAPVMTWALIFTAGMAIVTMELTGGFGLHSVGGGTGGGKKYINLFLGIATFFALASRGIPASKQRLYIGLFFLPAVLSIVSDLFPILPSPLNYINLIFPPSGYLMQSTDIIAGEHRLAGLGTMSTTIMIYMLARYGLRDTLSHHPIRLCLMVLLFFLSMAGGFRAVFIANSLILFFMFFLEGLHRTRWMFIAAVSGFLGLFILMAFPRQLPASIQRSLSILPISVDPLVRAEAEGSTEWRLNIWNAILPKIPDYLLLGKGYSLSELDYQSMGQDNPFWRTARVDASEEGLAISSDFHSGPLSTIICFGIWGCISILGIMAAGMYVLWRNYKYGDPSLQIVNALLLAVFLERILHFFLVFGAYDSDVGMFARYVGFSVALNWGVCKATAKAKSLQQIKPGQIPIAKPQAA